MSVTKLDVCMEIGLFALETGLELKDIIIGAGSALTLNGIRKETGDIDVTIPLEAHKALVEKYKDKTNVVNFAGRDVEIVSLGNIDVHPDDGSIQVTATENVCGLTCWSLVDILRLKKAWNREKDQADISAIEQLLCPI